MLTQVGAPLVTRSSPRELGQHDREIPERAKRFDLPVAVDPVVNDRVIASTGATGSTHRHVGQHKCFPWYFVHAVDRELHALEHGDAGIPEFRDLGGACSLRRAVHRVFQRCAGGKQPYPFVAQALLDRAQRPTRDFACCSSCHGRNVTLCNVQRIAPSVPAILDAGRALLERRHPSEVSLASVAAASGYSRMAVYRHFGSRAGLLTALLAHIDEAEGADPAVRAILRAPTPEATVEQLFTWWADYVPKFAGIARGVLATKHADEDLQAAWGERMRDLRRVCDAVAARCTKGGKATASFADQLWPLLSVPLWLQLDDEGWEPARSAQTMTSLALAALGTDDPVRSEA